MQDGNFAKFLTDEGWELPIIWEGQPMLTDLIDQISSIFPSSESWANDLLIWKSSEHDSDIYAFIEDDQLEMLQVRLDLRGNIQKEISAISNFAHKWDLSFLIMERERICPASEVELREYVFHSRAAKSYPLKKGRG